MGSLVLSNFFLAFGGISPLLGTDILKFLLGYDFFSLASSGTLWFVQSYGVNESRQKRTDRLGLVRWQFYRMVRCIGLPVPNSPLEAPSHTSFPVLVSLGLLLFPLVCTVVITGVQKRKEIG